jgi:drug/metabolite transporter (DMT)-like permease
MSLNRSLAQNASAASLPPSADRPSRAILLVLCTTFLFVSMDATAKLLTQTGMEPEAIIAIRFAMVASAVLGMVIYRWKERPLATTKPRLHILRGVLQIGAATSFVYGVRTLPLETATAIAFLSPLLMTALSVPFLGEKVGWRRWAAVLLGFGGVLLILRPGTPSFDWAMLFPMLASTFWASTIIITRAMRSSEKGLTVLAWSTFSGFAAVLPFGISAFVWPTGEQWLMLVGLACFHLMAQTIVIRAYMMASASVLAPFSYSSLVWATVLGFLIWGSTPDGMTVAGAFVLAGAGLYVWWRERKLASRA